MRYLSIIVVMFLIISSFAFNTKEPKKDNITVVATTIDSSKMRVMLFGSDKPVVHTNDFIEFAKSFLGTPYVWGSVNPKVGFDCSGFVNHVSKHFGFEVPRTSSQFASLGTAVDQSEAQAGDIILFSGSRKSKKVNHMGIIVENPGGELQFIHSSRGKRGVNLSGMTNYFQDRLVKIVRIFPLDSYQQIDVDAFQSFSDTELLLPSTL